MLKCNLDINAYKYAIQKSLKKHNMLNDKILNKKIQNKRDINRK